MTCLQCGSAHQRGRFCNRCGSKRPLTAPPATWAVRRSTPRSRTRLPTTPDRTTGSDPAIRELYDTALAREAAVGKRTLERYLSVLLATPGSA